jgi:hypothetical protein
MYGTMPVYGHCKEHVSKISVNRVKIALLCIRKLCNNIATLLFFFYIWSKSHESLMSLWLAYLSLASRVAPALNI